MRIECRYVKRRISLIRKYWRQCVFYSPKRKSVSDETGCAVTAGWFLGDSRWKPVLYQIGSQWKSDSINFALRCERWISSLKSLRPVLPFIDKFISLPLSFPFSLSLSLRKKKKRKEMYVWWEPEILKKKGKIITGLLKILFFYGMLANNNWDLNAKRYERKNKTWYKNIRLLSESTFEILLV